MGKMQMVAEARTTQLISILKDIVERFREEDEAFLEDDRALAAMRQVDYLDEDSTWSTAMAAGYDLRGTLGFLGYADSAEHVVRQMNTLGRL